MTHGPQNPAAEEALLESIRAWTLDRDVWLARYGTPERVPPYRLWQETLAREAAAAGFGIDDLITMGKLTSINVRNDGGIAGPIIQEWTDKWDGYVLRGLLWALRQRVWEIQKQREGLTDADMPAKLVGECDDYLRDTGMSP